MGKIVIDHLVLNHDTVAPLLRDALADDQAVYDRYPVDVAYLINVVAAACADAVRD